MKTFKFIYLALAAILISSCQAEIWEPANGNIIQRPQNSSSTEFSISSDDIKSISSVGTKASAAQDPNIIKLNQILSRIEDLNLKVYLKDNSTTNFFCSDKGVILKDGQSVDINDTYLISGYTFEDFNKSQAIDKSIRLHVGSLKSSQIKKIEVIANAGNNLGNGSWAGVTEKGHFDPMKNTCMMYSVSTETSTNQHLSDSQCVLYNISLKRSRAMVSVVLKDNGIKDGVVITPKIIRLINMPEHCNITALSTSEGNFISEKSNNIQEERHVTIGSLGNGLLKPNETKATSIGHHLDEGNTELSNVFFPFENRQGTTDNTTPSTKFPPGLKKEDLYITNPADIKNFKATYLEIECDYQKRKDSNTKKSEVEIGGTIIYRLYLGLNDTNDFNLIGNNYYKVTLSLTNYAGAKEDGKTDGKGNLIVNDADLSWRVDMQTKAWGFEKSQFDFDGHYIDGSAAVVGGKWKFNRVVKGDGNASWLVINIEERYGEHWANPTTIVEQNCVLNVVNGHLKFNLQPMSYYKNAELDPSGFFDETTYKKPVNYREMQIEVLNLDNKQTQIITVRQYAPIPVKANGETFFMERFEEYEEVDPQGNIVYGYPWKYSGKDLKKLYTLPPNNFPTTYNYEDYTKDPIVVQKKNNVGLNSAYLANPKSFNDNHQKNDKALSAASVCYSKGSSGVKQGAAVSFYALPSRAMMVGMFDMSAQYEKSWGPFEPLSPYNDYWTSSVDKNTPTQTYMYDGLNFTYKSVADRDTPRRVRAVYTVHQW